MRNSETMPDVNPIRPKRSGLQAVPAAQPTTRDLLERAGRGDEQAFSALYDDVAPMVFGVIKRVIRDQALSEEVTQEVFVEVWKLAPRYDSSKGSPHAWISTIAHRRAVDRVRSEQSRKNREQADVDTKIHTGPDVGDEVVADMVDQLDRVRVREALAALSEAQREAIELAYYGGRTYREVAVLLGIAEGTVKTRIRDGLIKVRDHMEVNR